MNKLEMSFASVLLAWVATGCGSDGGNNNTAASADGGVPTTTNTNAGPTGSNTTSPSTTGSTATTGPGTVGGMTNGTSTDGGVTNGTMTNGGVTTTDGGTQGTTGAGGMTSTNAGPDTTTATSTTGGTPVVRPSLVTSGPGSYWIVGEVTAGGSSATFTVTTSQTFQDWHGWGGTFNEAGWVALQALSAEERERAMKLLFDANEGIGFDWGRIPIGPSDYAIERYHLSDAPGQFSITHDEQYLIPYVHAAQAIKGDVKYWASPWTPPPWAKTDTGCGTDGTGTAGCLKNNGYDKGIFDTTYYQEYADFFVDWITAYEAAGIPIHSVAPQNEPGWSQGYPTCSFGPATDSTLNSAEIFSSAMVSFGPFIMDYLHPALQTLPNKPGIWFGTMSNDRVFGSYWNSLTDKTKVIGVALQWETLKRVTPGDPSHTTFPADYLIMQSEHKCGNYPWLGDNGMTSTAASKEAADYDTFWAPEAPNNHNYGVESWGLIRDWISNGVNIYSAWNMVLDTGGFNLDKDRPWPQNALLAVNESTGELQVTPYYYVFRHVAQYVDEGAVRVGVTGNALAFKNPDNSVVTIMFNEGQQAAATTLSVDGTMMQFEIPSRGWATVVHPAG